MYLCEFDETHIFMLWVLANNVSMHGVRCRRAPRDTSACTLTPQKCLLTSAPIITPRCVYTSRYLFFSMFSINRFSQKTHDKTPSLMRVIPKKITPDFNKIEVKKGYRKWRTLHVYCVGTKAHLQPDRKYSDTVNLYPWEFQSGSGSRRRSFWTSKSIRNEHTQKVTLMKSSLEKLCAGIRARIGKPSTVWYDVVGCKRHGCL